MEPHELATQDAELLAKIPEKHRKHVVDFLRGLHAAHMDDELPCSKDTRNVFAHFLEGMINGMFLTPGKDMHDGDFTSMTLSMPLLIDFTEAFLWFDIKELIHEFVDRKDDEEEKRWVQLEFILSLENMAKEFREQWGMSLEVQQKMIDEMPTFESEAEFDEYMESNLTYEEWVARGRK